MKKTILLTILLTSIFLCGCNNPTQENTTQPSSDTTEQITPPTTSDVQTPPATSETTTPPAEPTDNKPSESAKQNISIQGFAFNPSAVTVKVGETVTWTNEDSAPHDVKSDNFTSPLMAKGESFEYKFDTAGTYDYNCGIHPSMKGQVIVK